MARYLWFLLRLGIIVWFFVGGFDRAWTTLEVSVPPFLLVFICVAAVFGGFVHYAVLSNRKSRAHTKDDWSASLWFSPILKNPQSWYLTASLAFIAFGAAVILESLSSGGSALVALVAISMGSGVLCALVAFRIFHAKA